MLVLIIKTSAFGTYIPRFNFLYFDKYDYVIITNPLISAPSGNKNSVAVEYNKSKLWLLHKHVSTLGLLNGHMSAQYVQCDHMSVGGLLFLDRTCQFS